MVTAFDSCADFPSISLMRRKIFYFDSRRLSGQKTKDSDLLLAVICFLLIDVVINLTWSLYSGMHAIIIKPDPIRPSLNYIICDFGSMAFIYLQLGVK
ncbi:MAG: hypothetical protein Q7T57_09300, partial [Dehalococcoidales bacterium]|nr:hypothetical protein [Dehalococcoidales bacterium]